ncbi:hypothetical protein Nepgr_007429 [Nepenthes gracilis]|uniref:Uncharacterized protein n=1 Tax=Nepenthes gracilis TaxID=150966 RepID=A0AAD3S757_NEPGR|nr:hypothetical protein Nepgr_007429 [Nepenthes gracilis]
MSYLGKHNAESGMDSLSGRLKVSLSCDASKPDCREQNMGSPVSPLRTRQTGSAAVQSELTTTTTTSTSSSSSGSSASGQTTPKPVAKSHSGELSDTSPTVAGPRNSKPGHVRSKSSGSIGAYPIHSSGTGSVNSPPSGNILPSGRILKTGMATRKSPRTDVLGSGTGNYGHGSIMRGNGGGGVNASKSCGGVGSSRSGDSGIGVLKGNVSSSGGMGKIAIMSTDPEELKRLGNEQYKRGNFTEALSLYDHAIIISPRNAAYRCNKAAALTGLGRLVEAVKECEEAVRLDPSYVRACQRLGSLLIRFGQVEAARKYLFIQVQQPEASDLQKLQAVEKNLSRCSDARKIGDWASVLRAGDAAIAAGADFCPQLLSSRAESLLKLQHVDDANGILSHIHNINWSPNCCLQSKFFGMLSEAYLFYVRAQIEMALGRFEDAATSAEKAQQIDSGNAEVAELIKNVRLVTRARDRGNDLFKSERFTEACAAYEDGLRLDPANSIIYCNRAACRIKLGMWEQSVEDCNQALRIRPGYTKARLRRAASNSKLKRWVEAVRDYEVLRGQLPDNNEIAESLYHAQVELRKSRGEAAANMKFGSEELPSPQWFRPEVSSPGGCGREPNKC